MSIYASLQGNGHKPPSEAYRFQGLDLETRPYEPVEPACAAYPYTGRYPYTPLGTAVTTLVRLDRQGFLASQCGYCGDFIWGKLCRCHNGATPDVGNTHYVPWLDIPGHEKSS